MAINDFSIEFVAELNSEESKKKLNEDIDKIEKSINTLKLNAEIDTEKIEILKTQLNNLKIGLTDITISQTTLDNMVAQVNDALKNIYTGNIEQKIQDMSHSLSKIDSQDELTTRRAEVKGVKSETDAVFKPAQLSSAKEHDAQEIQLSIDNDIYNAKYDELIAKTQQWSVQNDELKTSVKELEAAYKGLDDIKTDEEKIAATKRWEQAVKSVTNATKQMKLKYATDDEIKKFHQEVQEFYDNNTAAHSRWGKDLEDMLNTTCSGAGVTREKFDEMYNSLKISKLQQVKLVN